MKNIIKLIAITALVAVIGFSFIACDDGNGGGGGGGGTAPTITTTALASGAVGTPYSHTLTATGDTPITWTLDSGTLPTGLNISTAGVISGTPTVANTFNFKVKATNGAGSGTKDLSIVIAPAGSPVINTETLPNGTVGTPYSQTLTATGDTPITWSIETGELPDGLSIGQTTGVISGTPTVADTFDFTVKATNAIGSGTEPFTIVIASSGHVHDFQWVTTKDPTETENGTETEVCSHNDTHTRDSRTLWATGTAGLVFELISINDGTDNAYRVHNGGDNTLFEAVHIPAFHRPDADSPYVPVTEIGNGTNTVNSNAFGGIGSSGTTPQTFTPSDPNTTLATVTFAAESQLTAIRNNAFFGCTSLDGITLPASVTSIGTQAFLGCTSLASITLPDSLESIGQLAFNKCTSLASVTIPAGVTTIDIYAFYGCTSLASITIPDSIQSIGSSAFQDCTSLASVSIGAGVTTWGLSAFAGCSSLASVTFAEGLTTIGSQAFMSCTSLRYVTFEGTIPSSGFPTNVFNNVAGGNNFRTKFYENDPDNGTPGTYIKSGDNTVYKQ